MRLAVFLSVLGCAAPLPATPRGVSDLSFAEDDSRPDLSSAGDLASATDLASAAASDLAAADLARKNDLSSAPDLAGALAGCTIVINEVATGTSTSGLEEFVELYNPCDGPVVLAQYQLVYRAAAGTSDIVLVADLKATVAKHGFLVLAGDGYYTAARQATMTSGLAELGGGVAVRDPAGRIVDSLGWGSATNAFVVGSPAPAPRDKAAPGRSLARSPDGHSQGSNAGDFAITDEPTPGAANIMHCSGC